MILDDRYDDDVYDNGFINVNAIRNRNSSFIDL